MKIKALIILLQTSLIGFAAIAQSKGFVIKGNIGGLKEGTVVELIPAATHREEKAIASGKVVNGIFTIKGDAPEPRLFSIKLEESYGIMPILLEDGNVEVTGTADTKGGYTTFTNVNVRGAKWHDEYQKRSAYRDELDKLYQENERASKSIVDAMNAASNKGDKAVVDSISKSEAWIKQEKEGRDFFSLVEKTSFDNFIKNGDSFFGPLMMLNYMTYISPERKGIYDKFSDEAKNSYYGKIVAGFVDVPKLDGKAAPVFDLVNEKNEKQTLAQLAKSKKYILLDFWASWCAPCRKAIPALKDLYSEYSSKGFEVLSISIDKDSKAWKKAETEEKFAWPSFLDHGSAQKAFNVSAIPTIFLIDSNGIVIKEFTGINGVEVKIKELLK